jgi:peptide/nickel transport system ATP-binding protein
MSPSLLTIENLSIHFGEASVLNGMGFQLNCGESIGLVGESGSGKSVTALAIMGLLPSTARIAGGSALFLSQMGVMLNLFSLNERELQRIRGKQVAMIFQEPMTSLNPSMKCGVQVEEAIELHHSLGKGDAKSKCLTLFEEMQLPSAQKVYSSYPFELSGGQKQRVMIAMALAGNPSLLIADEPTTALDVTVQKEIILLLRELQRNRGMSLLFISHDLGVISEITDRAIVLQKGNIMEAGSTPSLLSTPKNAYTQGLIACRPPIDTRPRRLLTVQDFINNSVNSIEITEKKVENLPTYDNEPVFTVENLGVDYVLSRNLLNKPKKIFSAVKSVNFNLYQNETLGIVGESGCGKTTIGRSLLNLIEHRQGTIKYKGVSISHMAPLEVKRFRREVQIVFQDPYSSLNPRLTIGEAIMEPLKVHRIEPNYAKRKVRALRLLEEVSLPDDSFYRYPHEFSGGQRQRIVIARALTLEPKVLICDEMVSALDVSVQAQILNLLNDLKEQRGLTYVFISHDLSVVRYMSNRVLVMQNGQIVEEGLSDEVFASPRSSYAAMLIDSIPGIKR